MRAEQKITLIKEKHTIKVFKLKSRAFLAYKSFKYLLSY